mgnify:CR=1 FL=1
MELCSLSKWGGDSKIKTVASVKARKQVQLHDMLRKWETKKWEQWRWKVTGTEITNKEPTIPLTEHNVIPRHYIVNIRTTFALNVISQVRADDKNIRHTAILTCLFSSQCAFPKSVLCSSGKYVRFYSKAHVYQCSITFVAVWEYSITWNKIKTPEKSPEIRMEPDEYFYSQISTNTDM